MAASSLLASGDPVAWTRALVATPSVNPALEAGGSGERGVAELVAPYLEGWGFEVERHEPSPGRVSLVARLPGARPGLILCGHLDTVGVAEMTTDPFEPGTDPDRIQGRGSADMKSGVAAILAAACRAAEDRRGVRSGREPGGDADPAPPSDPRHPPPPALTLVLTADEEHASLGLRHLLDGPLAPALDDVAGVVVTEPTSLALAPANKGFLWVTVRARGRAAHGSRPEVGRDAIRQLGRFLAALDRLDPAALAPPHPLLGNASFHAGTLSGGEAPSVYPAQAEGTLEFRLLPGQDPALVMDRLRALAQSVEDDHPGVPLEVEEGMIRPGASLDAEHPLASALADALRAEGVAPRVEPMTAWVEAAWFMEAGIPALCFGPGSIAQAHTADEWVAVEEIRVATRVLERLLQVRR